MKRSRRSTRSDFPSRRGSSWDGSNRSARSSDRGLRRWRVGGPAAGGEVDPAAAERGRVALTSTGYLKPAWSAEAYQDVAQALGRRRARPRRASPRPMPRPSIDDTACTPPPIPTTACRWASARGNGPDGSKQGIAIDCMACHGGSIGGTSYVGLGNTQLDLKLLFHEMLKAEGKRLPPEHVRHQLVAGDGQRRDVLGRPAEPPEPRPLVPDRSRCRSGPTSPSWTSPPGGSSARRRPCTTTAGPTPRPSGPTCSSCSARRPSTQFKELEPTFRDIQAYLKSLKPPKYPFPIDRGQGRARARRSSPRTAPSATGPTARTANIPSRIVELKTIGTDPARALGISPRFVAHYNSTWFGEESPVDEEMTGYQAPPLDGIWATAPYLHNGSVPTLATLLKSSDRPARFYRPPSTDFAHYDTGQRRLEVRGPGRHRPTPRPSEKSRSLFDSSRFGLGNGGHTFGDALVRRGAGDLIEYLKTL